MIVMMKSKQCRVVCPCKKRIGEKIDPQFFFHINSAEQFGEKFLFGRQKKQYQHNIITSNQSISMSSSQAIPDLPKPIPVEQLRKVPLQELAQNAQIREQELQQLQVFLQQLHVGYDRFRTSKNVVEQLSQQTAGKQILVPMTQSLYVPGEITDVDKVLVDVGTGYYVEKSTNDAKDVLERRMTMVRESIEKLTKTIAFKQSELEKIKRVVAFGVQERQREMEKLQQKQTA